MPRLALLVLTTLAVTSPLRAQYFGRNKVVYESFNFDVLKTPHFDIYFYPSEQDAATAAGRIAERWYARYTKLLNHNLTGRQPLILYSSHPDFSQTNAIPGDLGEGTGGVTEVLKRRIVLPVGSSLAETNHVIGHELVHAFQYDMTGEGMGVGFRVPGAARLPLWFIEGMAEYLSIGPVDPNTAMWMRDATLHNKLPSMKQLYDPRYFPYRWGQAFWAFIGGHYGDLRIGEILQRAGHQGDAQLALQQVTGIKADSLVKLWHRDIEAAYEPLQHVTDPPAAYGRLLVGGDKRPGLNVAPALSPDGNQLLFFSAIDLFSIDLYLADAHTGVVTRRITRTALDPHYQSLEFIYSAGAWDASGQRVAVGAVRDGQAVLSILNVAQDQPDEEIRLPELGEIFNPTWSPDGHYIAFSALSGGFTDLWRYDLVDRELERLTNDAYADIEPAWSPDGREIAFVTDRFSTKLDNLDFGAYELALLDVGTGAIRRLPTLEAGKSINPQWAPDGASIYFVSDRGGISNIYRVRIATGEVAQITNLYTGASGITDLSPALSVAGQSGRVVYGVYENSGYNLYGLNPTLLAGTPPRAAVAGISPAALPPQDRVTTDLQTALHDPDTGLPADSTFPVKPYKGRLSLDYITQPSLAVGVDRFGTYVGGGLGLFWSDMLGNDNLVTAAQVNGGFQDFSGLVAYQNTSHRWNWGIAAQQSPYYSGAYGVTVTTVGNVLASLEQTDVFRQTNRQLDLLAAYPLSTVERFEFSAGVNNMTYAEQLETRATSYATGQVLYDSVVSLPAPPGITVAMGSAAFVYDNSFFGATSPILGQRFRLEVDPAGGSIQWVTALADFRHYFMPMRPFTFAFRALTYGRYGGSAEDPRLTPLYLGYASLVRGYDIGSFSTRECPSTGGACPAFDRLLGSRLFVGNAELRFPLLGLLGLGSGYYGSFPIETALFADGGLAYCEQGNPAFCIGDNHPVYSTGVTFRVNLFGYAIGEVDVVHPFQRPQKGWYLEFSLTPGF